MARRNVVVFAPAPIPIGQEIEVHLVNAAGTKTVGVRDLATGILYGGGGIFRGAGRDDVVEGHKGDFRTSQPARLAQVYSVYRGRVVECVVANVSQNDGHAPCTSFVVEVADVPAGPYRG